MTVFTDYFFIDMVVTILLYFLAIYKK